MSYFGRITFKKILVVCLFIIIDVDLNQQDSYINHTVQNRFARGCTIFTFCFEEKVFFCGNLDHPNPDGYIWFWPASKEGYETQERMITVGSGEVAPESVFILPHYVVIKGLVADGKGNSVPDTILEFDTQNATVSNWDFGLGERINALDRQSQPPNLPIKTNPDGQFIAHLLVEKVGVQRVRAVWNEIYVKQFSFQLPKQPDMAYTFEEEIRFQR